MTGKVIVACVQLNTAPDIAVNLERIEPMLHDARRRGAQLITLPENVCLIIHGRDKLFARTFHENEHPAVPFFSRVARDTGTWIMCGSIAVAIGDDRLANRSLLFNPQGDIVARYDKIHMFDADVAENESYRESANFRGGDRAVLATTPWGEMGMTICYDVRFPHLYRALAKSGASLITVPAAFTYTTGKMHWHILLRARAIETGCFIIAPAQCGIHDGNRRTYGHSLIIAPSGEIIAEASEDKPDIILAELDLLKVADARRKLPSLLHDCDFVRPT
jgi:predicted amidohydrolase